MQRAASQKGSVIRTTLAERTYENLRERILDQTLPAGTRLNIGALTRELGVSTSPLREALARLEAERLVVLELYSGYSVAPNPSAKALRDLFDYRLLIEPYCARLGAPTRTAETLAKLRQAASRMAAYDRIGTKYKEYRDFIAADARFHQVIVDSAGNGVISRQHDALNIIIVQSRLYLSRTGGSPAGAVQNEHQAILDAYADRDGDAAAAAIQRHLQEGRERLMSYAAPD